MWTTTPWTLTSNVAAAVGPDLDYVKVTADDGWTYYLAEGALTNSLIGKDHEVLGGLKGSDLVGWEYSGPFDELPIVGRDVRRERATPTASCPGRKSARKRAPASCTSPPAAARRTST